jgi:hypothetical protein
MIGLANQYFSGSEKTKTRPSWSGKSQTMNLPGGKAVAEIRFYYFHELQLSIAYQATPRIVQNSKEIEQNKKDHSYSRSEPHLSG